MGKGQEQEVEEDIVIIYLTRPEETEWLKRCAVVELRGGCLMKDLKEEIMGDDLALLTFYSVEVRENVLKSYKGKPEKPISHGA